MKEGRDKHHRPVPLTHPAVDIPVKQFFATVDTERLELFLEENEKYEPFLAALRSAEYAHYSYAKIMKKFNVTLHELNTLYRDGNRNVGLFAMSTHLPRIMEDVSVDAESKQVTCTRCDGEKQITVSAGKLERVKDCPECNGAGTVRQAGDKHARDLVFESMGLTSVKGPMVAIQNNQFAMGAGGTGLNASMESMLRLTQGITMGERKVEPIAEKTT